MHVYLSIFIRIFLRFHLVHRVFPKNRQPGLIYVRILPFLFLPAPELLERHARLRTAHASLISEILDVLGLGEENRQHAPLERHLLHRGLMVGEADHRTARPQARDLRRGDLVSRAYAAGARPGSPPCRESAPAASI